MVTQRTVRILRNGQITIPKKIRDELNLTEDSLLELVVDPDVPGRFTLAPVTRTSEGSPWLKELYDVFAPVRDSYAKSGMTDAEINADLDAALREARAEQRPKRRKAS